MTLNSKTCSLVAILFLLYGHVLPTAAADVKEIPPQPLDTALRAFATQSGIQLVYVSEIAAGIQSKGTEASLSNQQALEQLLRGTGLEYEFLDSSTIMLKKGKNVPGKEVDHSKRNSRHFRVDEIVVRASQTTSWTGTSEKTDMLNKVPGNLGDTMKGVMMLPGMTSFSGDFSPPAVRGSAPEDNHYMFDSIPVGHMFNPLGFSMLNENIIHRFDLIPGGYGADISGATGSVFDITLRKPRHQDFGFTVDASMIRGSVLIESGLGENQAFYASVRRTMVDKFFEEQIDVFERIDGDDSKLPRSIDYQLKYAWDISDNSSLEALFLGTDDIFGRVFAADDFHVERDSSIEGLNFERNDHSAQALTWNHRRGQNNGVKVILASTDRKYEYGRGLYSPLTTPHDNGALVLGTDDEQMLKVAGSLHLNDQHTLMLGGNVNRRNSQFAYDGRLDYCTAHDPDCRFTRSPRILGSQRYSTTTYNAYLADQWQVNDQFSVNLGLHASTDQYSDYTRVEPRLSFRYQLSGPLALTGAAGSYHQHPTQGWGVTARSFRAWAIPRQTPLSRYVLPGIGNPELKPPTANHFIIGLERNIDDNWSWKAEIYHKELDDMIGATRQTDFSYDNGWSGTATGAELLITKLPSNDNRFSGWAAFSVARARRTDKETGVTTRFLGDLPFGANLVVNYQLNEKWSFGVKAIYAHGRPYSPIVGFELDPNNDLIPIFGELNSEDLPDYLGLDLHLQRDWEYKTLNGAVFLDVLNALDRTNASNFALPTANPDLTLANGGERDPEAGLELLVSLGIKFTY